MKRKILVYLFVLATAAFIYLPAPAEALAKDANNGSVKTLTANGQTRYVHVRGRRYRVRYRVYRRHGRRYIRILRVRRA